MSITKFSQSIPTSVYNGLERRARQLRRETHEYIQRVLIQHVIDQQTITADEAERLQLVWYAVDQCVETARQICRDGRFSEHITLEVIQRCAGDPSWLEVYAKCIEDDVYKHGNPLKGRINRAIGAQIRAAIGGVVKKDSNGKPVMRRVLGEVIQSYTLFEGFDREVIDDDGGVVRRQTGHGRISGDSCLQGESAP